jgi:hypothetical protein
VLAAGLVVRVCWRRPGGGGVLAAGLVVRVCWRRPGGGGVLAAGLVVRGCWRRAWWGGVLAATEGAGRPPGGMRGHPVRSARQASYGHRVRGLPAIRYLAAVHISRVLIGNYPSLSDLGPENL